MERPLEIDKWAGSLLVNGPYLLARTHLKEVGEGGASRCFRKRWRKRRSSDLDLQEFEKGVRGVFREGVRGS